MQKLKAFQQQEEQKKAQVELDKEENENIKLEKSLAQKQAKICSIIKIYLRLPLDRDHDQVLDTFFTKRQFYYSTSDVKWNKVEFLHAMSRSYP